MASNDRDYELQMTRRQIARERIESARSPFTRGRALEAGTAARQLKTASWTDMRSPSGQFYFVVGYSVVGGPDVIR